MASAAIKEEIQTQSCLVKKKDLEEEEEDDDEELFEINLEAVNSIPPPHYWEAFFTATSSALLANCLLPISDLSTAIPMVSSTACRRCRLSKEGIKKMAMVAAEASLPGKFFGMSSMEAFGVTQQVQNKEMRA